MLKLGRHCLSSHLKLLRRYKKDSNKLAMRSKGYPRQRVDILVYGDILLVTWGQGFLIAADKLPVRTEQWHLLD